MPNLDDNIEDLEPSADPNLDEQQPKGEATAEPQKGAEGANSSDATGEEDKDLLSVVRDVVDKNKPKSDPASPADGDEDGDRGDKQAKKPDDESYTDVPFHKHPRFQHLLRKSKTFEQDAIRYQNVQNFITQQGLNADEAAELLIVGGLRKTDPVATWQRIKPWVQQLLVDAGEVLPDDLQQRVQSGELSREAAYEISRTKAAHQSMQTTATFRQQQEEQRRQQETGAAITGAAQSWEAERRERDPNFDAKIEPLMKEVAWLQAREGKPKTPEGVREQLQKAYKAVNAAFVPPKPATTAPKPALRPVTGGQVAGNQQPKGATTLDIVRANRRAS